MKKLILIQLLILISAFAIADESGICGENLTWTFVETTGKLTITGSGKMSEHQSSSSAPWFKFKDKITQVILDRDITTIANYAFWKCKGITSITIPNGVVSIGSGAFYGTSLTSITLPYSLLKIGDDAFGNTKLTTISIPSKVISISGNPVSACPNLTSIKVDSENIAYNSRNNCNAIIGSSGILIAGCKNTVIPNGVEEIGADAFDHCTGLTSITLPNSVKVINACAFSGCI